VTRDESAQLVRDAHHVCRDLFALRPRRYWGDFLTSILIAYTAFWLYVRSVDVSPVWAAALVICALALYRAVVFTHEITHRRTGALRGFPLAWNALCGIPSLMPSFLYGDHKGHHSPHAYGTWADPEYLLRTPRWRARLLLFILLPLVYPFMAFGRFLILTPLALLSRRIDRLVWRYASSLYVMNEFYRREYDALAVTPSRWLLELACSAWVWTVVALTATGHVSGIVLWKAYFMFLFWLTVNQVRTLAAHRYANLRQMPMSYRDQLLDTNTFGRGKWLPDLWAPLGLRYHALHHLLPALPYHAMGAAHRRLLESLPPGSPYHRTLRLGLWQVLAAIPSDLGKPADQPDCRR
jgi:fatty acid desaturase